jgi:hypothetical protein
MRGPAATELGDGTAVTSYVSAAVLVDAVGAGERLGSVPFGDISLVEAAGMAAWFVEEEAIVTAAEASPPDEVTAAAFVSACSAGRSVTTGVIDGGT